MNNSNSNLTNSLISSQFRGLIGAARRDITPPQGIYARQWGAATHDIAEGVHHPLTLTVISLHGADGNMLMLIGLDGFIFFEAEVESRIRSKILDAYDLPPASVLMNCSHTHASCSISKCDKNKPGGELVEPYLQQIEAAALQAAHAANENAQSATISWDYGLCDLAVNRDLQDPDPNGNGRYICGYNPETKADNTVLVGRVTRNSDGKITATIVNYACHPTTLAWQNKLISPDYVGAMREVVESNTGAAPCLFLQGASGELAPRQQYTDNIEVADANGKKLGFAVLATLSGMLPPNSKLQYERVVESGAPLAIWRANPFQPSSHTSASVIKVKVPLKNLPRAGELENKLAHCKDRALAERLYRKLQIVRQLGSSHDTQLSIWIWRVGDMLFVAQPQEAYSLFQTELRKQFPDRKIAVLNLTNGAYAGYLYPQALSDCDLYQVWQSPFAPGALEKLITTSKTALNELLKN